MIKRCLYLLLLLPMIILSCVTHEKVHHAELIAHAGGEIDGHIYTNSREALEKAVTNGYRYIEFDFLFTSDSVLVAAHSWEDFNHMTGNANWGDSVLLLKDFTLQRIHDRYTPLSAEDINSFFMQHDSLYLVTDKISDPEVLEQYFPDLKHRMVVEAFSYRDYKALVDKGYYRVLYSCMADDMASALLKHLLLHRLFPGERIEWVALHTTGFNHPMFRFLNKVRHFNVALFTVDSLEEIPAEQSGRAGMIYTNRLLPNSEGNIP